jgi:hypothetical protein
VLDRVRVIKLRVLLIVGLAYKLHLMRLSPAIRSVENESEDQGQKKNKDKRKTII